MWLEASKILIGTADGFLYLIEGTDVVQIKKGVKVKQQQQQQQQHYQQLHHSVSKIK